LGVEGGRGRGARLVLRVVPDPRGRKKGRLVKNYGTKSTMQQGGVYANG